MIRITFSIVFLLVFGTATFAQNGSVLIVADEFPAMEVLAKALKEQEGIDSKIIAQTDMPLPLTDFRAVLVYIHKDLNAEPERAFINYAQNGGRLIVLHHSISSAKRKNEAWLPMMGVDLSKKDVSEGGYKYVGGINMEVVNLAPRHFVTTHKIKYPDQIAYSKEDQTIGGNCPGFVLQNTEAFLNHTLLTPRTILLGFKMTDQTGKTWMQDRAAWYLPVGKGLVFYSQPGHAVSDFENPTYARMVINMVIYQL